MQSLQDLIQELKPGEHDDNFNKDLNEMATPRNPGTPRMNISTYASQNAGNNIYQKQNKKDNTILYISGKYNNSII